MSYANYINLRSLRASGNVLKCSTVSQYLLDLGPGMCEELLGNMNLSIV